MFRLLLQQRQSIISVSILTVAVTFLCLSNAWADKDTEDPPLFTPEEPSNTLFEESEPAKSEDPRITELREDIGIMAGVIERILEENLPGHFEPSNLFREGVQGWYIEGLGVFFSCEVNFNVTDPPDSEEPEKTEEPSSDLWEEVKKTDDDKAQKRGRRARNNAGDWNAFVFNTKSGRFPFGANEEETWRDLVERLDKAVLEAIHVYGPRIRGLKRGEEIVVSVFGTNGSGVQNVHTFFKNVSVLPPVISSVAPTDNEAIPDHDLQAVLEDYKEEIEKLRGDSEHYADEVREVRRDRRDKERELRDVERQLREKRELFDVEREKTEQNTEHLQHEMQDLEMQHQQLSEEIAEMKEDLFAGPDSVMKKVQEEMQKAQEQYGDVLAKLKASSANHIRSFGGFGQQSGNEGQTVRTYRTGNFKQDGHLDDWKKDTSIFAY